MSIRLAVHSIYTIEPVATYLKMPWKYHLPSLSLKADTCQALFHLASEAAPLILRRTAGYALLSFARLTSQAYQLTYRDHTRWEKMKIGLEIFSTLSPILMIVSGVAPGYFIAATVVRIGMELKDEVGELRNFHKLSKRQICDRLLTVISHAFYLLALGRAVSYQIRLASIAFQGGVAFYQASQQAHKPAGLIWALIGTLRLYQGYRYFQFKTQNKPQFVYKQRHAEKQKDVKHPSLTEFGHEQARQAGPLVEKYLSEKTGITHWTYASSTYLRSRQTASGMLKGLNRSEQPFFIDSRLRENIRGESNRYRYRRHEAAIDDLVDEIGEPDQGILTVDHACAGRCYARRVEKTDPLLTEKHVKYAEGFLFKRQDGKTELLDRFLPQTTPSTLELKN